MPAFHLPRLIELRYQDAIARLFKFVLPTIGVNQPYEEWVQELGNLGRDDTVKHLSRVTADVMVRQVNTVNARSWKEASAKSQRSRMLYQALKEELAGQTRVSFNRIVDRNAELIRSIPGDVAQKLNVHIAEAQQSGLRAGAVGSMLREKFPEFTKNKIQLIARTQTQAASTDLTEARSLDVGLDWFEWLTSEDSRVRPAHKNMAGVLCSWYDLPDPERLIGQKSSLGKYAPGRCPNCRCPPSPILTLDDVSWPHRVYHAGSISRMTRTQFQQLSGIQSRRKSA